MDFEEGGLALMSVEPLQIAHYVAGLEKLIFFTGIERVRFHQPVCPGDVVVIEAIVRRLRSRMGVLSGRASVNGKLVCHGTMTFALGDRPASE